MLLLGVAGQTKDNLRVRLTFHEGVAVVDEVLVNGTRDVLAFHRLQNLGIGGLKRRPKSPRATQETGDLDSALRAVLACRSGNQDRPARLPLDLSNDSGGLNVLRVHREVEVRDDQLVNVSDASSDVVEFVSHTLQWEAGDLVLRAEAVGAEGTGERAAPGRLDHWNQRMPKEFIEGAAQVRRGDRL